MSQSDQPVDRDFESQPAARPNDDSDETFRQLAILIEQYGFTREHPTIARAAEFLLSFQTREGDIRGIYGNQYATTYVGAIMELLVKAGYSEDSRLTTTFNWLLATRQSDGGWAIPMRTFGHRFRDFLDVERYPEPLAPDRSKPFSHLVTGMVLRAFAADPDWREAAEVRLAGELLASRLFKRDPYGDRGDASYWERVSFPSQDVAHDDIRVTLVDLQVIDVSPLGGTCSPFSMRQMQEPPDGADRLRSAAGAHDRIVVR